MKCRHIFQKAVFDESLRKRGWPFTIGRYVYLGFLGGMLFGIAFEKLLDGLER